MGIRSVKSKIEIELWQMNERFATLLGKTALEYQEFTCEENKKTSVEFVKSSHLMLMRFLKDMSYQKP